MKYLLNFILFFLIALPVRAKSHENCPTPIRVGWCEFPPFTQTDKESDYGVSGIDVDLFNLMADDVGCDVIYVKYNQKSKEDNVWMRLLQDLKFGKIDVLTSVSKTEERNKFAHFHVPYILDTNALFMNKEDIETYSKGVKKIKNFIEFKKILGFKIGVVQGIYYGKEFELAKKDPDFDKIIVEYTDDLQLFEAMKKNKINAFLEDIVYTNFKIENSELKEKIDIFPIRMLNEGVYFAFSRKSFADRKPLVRTFDQSLNKFIKKGDVNDAFGEILLRYLYKNQVEMIRRSPEKYE